MAALVNSELPDYILNDLIPMEEEIDNWVNHDFWYTSQCIDHYDTDFSLANVPGTETRSIPKSTVVSSYCPPQSLATASINPNVFIGSEQTPCSTIPTLKVEVESPVSSIYMVQNEPTVFVPSPTIPLQGTSSDSGIAHESFVTSSSCSSPVPSATPSEADSIYIQEGHMITFLKSDKGLEMFSKAHGIPKDDLVGFLDSKKADDFYNHQHSSPTDAEDKHDEDFQKRRRHRGTYSKSTCLKVIQFVKKGYSARAAAKKFGIPKSTVHNWLHEDVSTRPEKGHRKKDLHPDKLEDYDHDYNKNMNDLGHSFAQTSIKDEPKYSTHNEQSMLDETFCNSSETVPITSQSALVQLLTTNRQLNSIKREFQPSDVGFAQSDIDNVDLNVIDDIFQPDDWIGHEQWYKQQYHNHYNKDNTNGRHRKSYGTYSNEHRKRATDYVKSGKTLSAASKEFNIPKSTIHTWLNEGNIPCELPPELENFVVDEIEQSKDGNSSPSLAIIKKKAEEVAVPHLEKFRPSFAWCRDFMKRHYMDRDEEVDSKKICLEDLKKKEAINNLVSALGLNTGRKDLLSKINMTTGSSAESPSL